MRSVLALAPALLVVVAASVTPTGTGLLSSLRKREELDRCSGLTITENNGDRKVVIVIDRSFTLGWNDPAHLRFSTAHALNAFLISRSEASGGKKADQVAVISSGLTADTVFGPGDPGDPLADKAIASVDAWGRSGIRTGIRKAIDNIAAMSGPTQDRSAIVVLTDGDDFGSTNMELVSAIKNATALGIRVSIGFLENKGISQPKETLLAVRESNGVHGTFADGTGSISFLNYVLLNGLSSRDNPQGVGDRLFSGLASTQVINGSSSVTMKYFAEQGEKANFTLVSITGDTLNMEAHMNGTKLNSTDLKTTAPKAMEVVSPSTGEMVIVIRASNSPKDGLFSIHTSSSAPNCTVGMTGGNNTGLSTGAKAGIGVGAVAAFLALVGVGYMVYRHLLSSGKTTAAPLGGNATAPALANGENMGYQAGGEKLDLQTTSTAIPPNHTRFEGTMVDQPVPRTGDEMSAPSALHPAVPPPRIS